MHQGTLLAFSSIMQAQPNKFRGWERQNSTILRFWKFLELAVTAVCELLTQAPTLVREVRLRHVGRIALS